MRKWNSVNGFEYSNKPELEKGCKSYSDFLHIFPFETSIGEEEVMSDKNSTFRTKQMNREIGVNIDDLLKEETELNDIEGGFHSPHASLGNLPKLSRTFTDSSIEDWNVTNNGFPEEIIDNQDTLVVEDFYCESKSNIATFSKFVNNLFENPEGRLTNLQRIAIILYTCFETYRTIISSFLTVFVPQKCGGYSCSILENIIPKDDIEIAAISINTFMAFYFCILFMIESTREAIVKKYLTYDKSYATNKGYLIKMLSTMKENERNEMFTLNAVYRGFAQGLLIFFFINAGISCVVIQKNYLNNTTSTVFITNMFFTINRIHKALKITSSGEYNIYSTYRSENLIYNRYRGELMHDRPPGIIFPYVYKCIQMYSDKAKN